MLSLLLTIITHGGSKKKKALEHNVTQAVLTTYLGNSIFGSG